MRKKRSLGINGRPSCRPALIAIALWLVVTEYVGLNDTLDLSVIDYSVSLGYFYPVLILLVLMGATNGVNLTDGLDGLAAGCCAIVPGLHRHDVHHRRPGPGGPCAGVRSAWWARAWGSCGSTRSRSSVFMGDTGSLGLGGAIAAIAVVTKTEVLLLLIGGIFVIEALSVLIQVFAFQRFRRRVFLMAPIHHHFEMMAWSETKIILRFCRSWPPSAAPSASPCTSSRSHDPPAGAAAGGLLGRRPQALGPGGRPQCWRRTARSSAWTPGERRPCPGTSRPHLGTDGVDLLRPAPALVVKSPGVPRQAPVVAAALERGHRCDRRAGAGVAAAGHGHPFVAVTGTNGKTTTVELLGAIWRAAGMPVEVAGNVGRPVADLVNPL